MCFFHPEGPQAGAGRGGPSERRNMGRVFKLNSVHCTALGAGGHRVQHSSRALSVYTTAAALGRGSLA